MYPLQAHLTLLAHHPHNAAPVPPIPSTFGALGCSSDLQGRTSLCFWSDDIIDEFARRNSPPKELEGSLDKFANIFDCAILSGRFG